MNIERMWALSDDYDNDLEMFSDVVAFIARTRRDARESAAELIQTVKQLDKLLTAAHKQPLDENQIKKHKSLMKEFEAIRKTLEKTRDVQTIPTD